MPSPRSPFGSSTGAERLGPSGSAGRHSVPAIAPSTSVGPPGSPSPLLGSVSVVSGGVGPRRRPDLVELIESSRSCLPRIVGLGASDPDRPLFGWIAGTDFAGDALTGTDTLACGARTGCAFAGTIGGGDAVATSALAGADDGGDDGAGFDATTDCNDFGGALTLPFAVASASAADISFFFDGTALNGIGNPFLHITMGLTSVGQSYLLASSRRA